MRVPPWLALLLLALDGAAEPPAPAGPRQPLALAGSALRCGILGGSKGRGLVAARDVRAGARLLAEEPYAFAPAVPDGSHALRSHLTLRTPPEGVRLVVCPRCNFARYASREEQQADWPAHSDECGKIARCHHHGHLPSATLLLVARILARKRREGARKEGGGYDDVLLLDDHYGNFSIDQMAMIAQVTYTVRDFMGGNSTDLAGVDMREVVHMLCRLHVNAFTIVDDDLIPCGLGLYPGAALANHDCRPNAIVTFEGTRLQIRALSDIRAGEEVTISYVDVAECTETRTKYLRAQYLFNCTCSRCSGAVPDIGTPDDEVKRGLKCVGNEGCPGWLLPWTQSDFDKYYPKIIIRSFAEHFSEVVKPFEECLDDDYDAETRAEGVDYSEQPPGGLFNETEGPKLPGLDQDVDDHLRSLEDKGGLPVVERTVKEAREEALRRFEVLRGRFQEREMLMYAEVDVDSEWVKKQEKRFMGDEWDEEEGRELREEARKEAKEDERMRLLDDESEDENGTARKPWSFKRARERWDKNQSYENEALQEVFACCVCRGMVHVMRVDGNLRALKRFVGGVRGIKWQRMEEAMDVRSKRIMQGKPHEGRLSVYNASKEDERELVPLLLDAADLARQVLHSQNIALMRLREAALHQATRAGCWEEAIELSESLIQTYALHYPEHTPILSVQHAFVGKALVYVAAEMDGERDGDMARMKLEQAARHLRKSLTSLDRTHGESHSAVRTVRELLFKVEMCLQGQAALN